MGLFKKIKKFALDSAHELGLISIDTYCKNTDDEDLKSFYYTVHGEANGDNYCHGNKPRAQQEQKQRIERQINEEIEFCRNQYRMSSSATIDYQAFLQADNSTRSKIFSEYLLTACEENIPLLTQSFLKVNPDKKHVESEVAAYFQFIGLSLMRSVDLYELDFLIDFTLSNEENERDASRFENRMDIYFSIMTDSPIRAYWDPSGKIVKNNSNPLISCLMAMSDFIWEPGLIDSTSYDEYINHPITIKSIDKAMEFQRIYADVNMQIALFMDMVASTAQRLGILPMQ